MGNARARGRGDEEPAGRAGRPPGYDEVNLPPADPVREAKERDVDDPADARADPTDLRDGGPARPRGAATTTGGKAGPASVRRVPRKPGTKAGKRRVAETTTGDATSGGMTTPVRSSTSDATTGGAEAGGFTGERRPRH